MRNHTYLLDHHRRSHYDTVTIGPEGMMNWVLQLNNNQSGNSFNSLGEVQRVKLSKPTQPKPKPICDRSGKLDGTEDVFVVKGETSRSHEIDEKGLHEELGSSDRSVKPEKLSEDIRVEQTHDGSGQLDEQNSSSAHTVKEQSAPEENRDIASFNTDNEFNRAITLAQTFGHTLRSTRWTRRESRCPTYSAVPTSDLYCCVSCSSRPSAPSRKPLPTVFDQAPQ